MSKNLFLFILCLTAASTYVIANQTATTNPANVPGQPTTLTPAKKIPTAKDQNNPTVGGRQSGSEQLFGQSATPSNTKQAETNHDTNKIKSNNPAVGGRQAGSEQLFGQSATPPSTKQKYTNPHINKGNSNNPAVGGRQAGSEQLFGQSATPEEDNPKSK